MKTTRNLCAPHSTSTHILKPFDRLRTSRPAHDEIAAMARTIWERKGRIEGLDTEIWLEAELTLYEKAERRTKIFTAAKTIFDEDLRPTHAVEVTLADFTEATGSRSPTSL